MPGVGEDKKVVAEELHLHDRLIDIHRLDCKALGPHDAGQFVFLGIFGTPVSPRA